MASGTLPASFHLFCVSQMFFCVIQTPQTLIRLSITLFSNLPLPMSVFFCPYQSFLFIRQSQIWLFLCHSSGQHPRVASSLYTLTLAFCGYHLKKLPVEDL